MAGRSKNGRIRQAILEDIEVRLLFSGIVSGSLILSLEHFHQGKLALVNLRIPCVSVRRVLKGDKVMWLGL